MTTFMRLAAPLVLMLLSACATGPQAPSGAFYVMRHLHTNTAIRDPDLTEEGARQAQLLADRLKDDPPSAIYVTDTKRARQTAAPLAAKLGTAPTLYAPRDMPALKAAVMKESGSVLIVGHSNTVPDIVEALGGARPAPLADTDFGDLWRVSRRDGAVIRSKVGGD